MTVCLLVSSFVFGAITGGTSNVDTSKEKLKATGVAVTISAPRGADKFSDIPKDSWYYAYVDALVKNGVINGKSESEFCPEGSFSVAECAAVVVRYLGLEKEARKAQKSLIDAKKTGSDLWYSGYIQLLNELNVLVSPEFAADENALLNLSRDVCERPIKRYEFADCIARSFDLDGEKVRAKNTFSELGGLGHEFICCGAYDLTALSTYSLFIRDFEDVSENARDSVLKVYYDGIFNGDVSGNFYPNNNLTRAEMAKVLATITDYSLRTKLQSPASKNMVLSEKDFILDAKGEKYLTNSTAESILLCEAEGVKIDSNSFFYEKQYVSPLGYCVDVYVYEQNQNNSYRLIDECTLHNSDVNKSKKIFEKPFADGKIMLVLRNLSENLRSEGVLEIKFSKSGVTERSFCYREPQNVIIEKTD